MFKARIVIRILLVFLLAAVGYVGYRVWLRRQPDHFWNYAQTAMAEDDLPTARLYLENLIERFPEHAPGHRALAEVLVQEANAAGKPATFANHRQALYHLEQACQLAPDDLELQQRLLKARLARREVRRAAEVAKRVVAAEPDDVDALYALAWDAVESRDAARADPLLQQLAGLSSSRPFAILGLAAKLHADGERPERLQRTLGIASDLAARLERPTYAALSVEELATMHTLLLAAVQQAPDGPTATRRAAACLRAYEELSAARRAPPGELATRAAHVVQALTAKEASAAGPPPPRPEIDEPAERLRAAAIAAGEGEPLVYWQSAQAAFERGQTPAALDILRRGLAAAERATAAAPSSADVKTVAEQRARQQRGVLALQLLAARRLLQMGRAADAEPHLKALIDHPESAGWGHLLAGAAALSEGKIETAHDHLLKAQTAMGSTLLVRIGLANTFAALGNWKEAAGHLQSLRASCDALSDEERAWTERFFGTGVQWIAYRQLLAELNLKQWDKAQPLLADLRGSELEARGEAAAAAYLWRVGQQRQARERLSEAQARLPRAKELLAVALSLLEAEGKLSEADKVLEDFVAAAPADDWQSRIALVEWRLRRGQPDRALEQIASLEAQSPPDARHRDALVALRAMALTAQGKAEEAVRLLEPLRRDPRTAAAAGLLVAAAEMRLDLGDKAAESLAAARLADPRNAMLNHLEGELAMRRGDYAKAAECLGASLSVTALRERAAAVLGQLVAAVAERRSLDEAEACVDTLLRRAPREPVLLAAKATLQLQRGKAPAALELLDRADREKPNDPLNAARKAGAWLQAGQPPRALAEAKRGLKLDPRNAACLVAAAQASLAADKPDDALKYIDAALRDNARYAAAVLVRAESLVRLDRRGEALEALTALAAEQPQAVEAHRGLGRLLVAEGEVEKALAAYRAGRKALPDSLALLGDEVGLLAAQDRLAEARQVADRVAEQPTAAHCAALAGAFEVADRLDEAERWLTRGLAAAEERQRPGLRFLLGNNALKQHRARPERKLLERAHDHFAAVVAADPAHLMAANNLAWLLATEFKQPQEAAALLDRGQPRQDGDSWPPEVVHTAAVVYRLAGRPNDARRLLEQSLTRHPKHPALWLELAAVLAEGTKPDEARLPLQRALDLGLSAPDAERAKRLLEVIERGDDRTRLPDATPQQRPDHDGSSRQRPA